MEILDEQKKKISKDLRYFVDNVAAGSQNKASKMLQGVSNAYISHILKGNFDPISDAMWHNISKQVSTATDWVFVQDRPYVMLNHLYTDARLNANTYGVIGRTGYGKTSTADVLNQENVFVVKCNEYFTSKDFLGEILRLMGKGVTSYKIANLMRDIIEALRKMKNPLLIIDEADKLNDKVLYFFISLYNALEGKCGIIIQATPYLKTRITNGVERNKKGYAEINSRIGGKFLEVPKISRLDVLKICAANGVTDELIATDIYNSSEGDKRIVKRLIHANLKSA